jgi:vacuolar-type H+-ATPase subunit F/Vma7
MGTVVALGDTHELEGFALAGVRIVVTTGGADTVRAWRALDDEVGLVILSPASAAVLGDELVRRPDLLTAVMP